MHCSVIGYWHDNAVCLSVTVCIVAKRYIIQQKCLNNWIASALLRTRLYNFQPPTPPCVLKLPTSCTIDVGEWRAWTCGSLTYFRDFTLSPLLLYLDFCVKAVRSAFSATTVLLVHCDHHHPSFFHALQIILDIVHFARRLLTFSIDFYIQSIFV